MFSWLDLRPAWHDSFVDCSELASLSQRNFLTRQHLDAAHVFALTHLEYRPVMSIVACCLSHVFSCRAGGNSLHFCGLDEARVRGRLFGKLQLDTCLPRTKRGSRDTFPKMPDKSTRRALYFDKSSLHVCEARQSLIRNTLCRWMLIAV